MSEETETGVPERGRQIADVERIEQDHVPILRKEQLAEVVETPLLPACEILWDKHIPTFMTSANGTDFTERQAAWMIFRFGDLSHENLGIGKELGEMKILNAGPCVWLDIPLTEQSTVAEVSAAAEAMAARFAEQSPSYLQLVFDAAGVRAFWEEMAGKSIAHISDADLAFYTGFEHDEGTGLFFRQKGVRERYLQDAGD